MATDRFAECLAFTLKEEGRFANNPQDPGGATNFGITLKTFRLWRKDEGTTVQQLRDITQAEVAEVYHTNYWLPIRCQDLPPGVDGQIFDFGVNAGPRTSVHLLQRTLGVTVDGIIGNVTLGFAHAAGLPLIAALASSQQAYYAGLPGYATFGRGWKARTVRRAATATLAFDAAPESDGAVAERAASEAAALEAFRAHPLNTPDPATVAALPQPVTTEAKAPLNVDPMPEISDVVSGGLKGAAAGAILGPIGAGAGAAVGIAVQLVPGLTRWIAGDGGDTINKVVSAVQQATGSSNAATQTAAVSDPQVAGDLAVQLAQIVADKEAAHETTSLETLKAGLGDVVSARQTAVSLASQGSAMAWAAPTLSVIVIAGFITMIFVVTKVDMPTNSAPLANVLLGTLSAMAIQVCNYFLGSSSGSERKTTLLANSIPAHLVPTPAVVLPASAIAPASIK